MQLGSGAHEAHCGRSVHICMSLFYLMMVSLMSARVVEGRSLGSSAVLGDGARNSGAARLEAGHRLRLDTGPASTLWPLRLKGGRREDHLPRSFKRALERCVGLCVLSCAMGR